MKILSRSSHCPGGIDSNPALSKHQTEVLSLEATCSVKETTSESQLQRCSFDGGLVERLHFASLQSNINQLHQLRSQLYLPGCWALMKTLITQKLQSAHIYLLGKGNNSFYTAYEPTNCKINNNHLSFTFLLYVSTSTRASSGRYIQRHTSTANLVKDMLV
jgi:hypothetical protein